MADVYIVVFTLAGILLSLPALLVALNLLLPKVTTNSAPALQKPLVALFYWGFR